MLILRENQPKFTELSKENTKTLAVSRKNSQPYHNSVLIDIRERSTSCVALFVFLLTFDDFVFSQSSQMFKNNYHNNKILGHIRQHRLHEPIHYTLHIVSSPHHGSLHKPRKSTLSVSA